MAATERNEVILSEGNGLQDTKLLTDKINAVCRIEIVIEDSKSGKRQRKRGTGFLSKLYTPSERGCSEIYGVVTNNHVLPSETDAKNAIVTFGYDRPGEGEKVKLKPKIMFRTEKELDYTFVGVKKADIDSLKLAIEPILMEPEPELKKGVNVMIIQHPKGEPKKFSQEKISKVKKPFVFYKADTESGSSGSPVLTYEGLALIAVHHKGNEKQGYNKGTLISQILKHLQEGSSSGSTEVEQKEKSGPAAKKLKLDPFGKPGTSGVSSTSKTRKFKATNTDGSSSDSQEERIFEDGPPPKVVKIDQGDNENCDELSQDLLVQLSREIAAVWKPLGLTLKVPKIELDAIQSDNVQFPGVTDKALKMLSAWIDQGQATLHDLSERLKGLGKKGLADKYCGRAEEMQQESQGKRPSSRKRVAVPEEEERSSEDGHKTKKRQAVFPEEGPSSREENEESIDLRVRKGNPKDDELEELANKIDPSVWKTIGRKLKIDEARITAIGKKDEEFSEKIYTMLREWKQKNGRDATWEALYQGLKKAGLRDLAEKHCCENIN